MWTGEGAREPGLHAVQWPLRQGKRRDAPLVAPGEYQVQLAVGSQKQARTIRVEAE